VGKRGAIPSAAPQQDLDRPCAQEPHARVHHVVVGYREVLNFPGARFLEEKGEFAWTIPAREENAEVLGYLRFHPHAKRQNVHLGKRREMFPEAEKNVATGNQSHRVC